MNALYSVYSLHISSSKIKLLLKICKGFTNSDLANFMLLVNLKALHYVLSLRNAETILE